MRILDVGLVFMIEFQQDKVEFTSNVRGKMEMKKTCPCCRYITLKSELHDICEICFWQDDPNFWERPDEVGGANGDLSLRQAQQNYLSYGACEECCVDVVRPPNERDIRDHAWKVFSH
ncbi:CPCC family cysteine-rich protein [Brevibacillus laterosporus]|uniref:CPCC family cysteine-rich protein n=1 Tax=Brevibacillus laterosporus TaxID=1465 RepID=UPI00269BB6CD